MRKPIIAGNWKLNKTIKEALELITLLKRQIIDCRGVDVVVCPPFTALAESAEILLQTDIKVGAQNIYWEESGAFTGEISATLVKEAGATYVIIGHSERRQFFGETHQSVNKKTVAALKAGLTPIVCVGELLAEREANKTFDVIGEQLKGAFSGFPPKADPPPAGDANLMSKVIIAYEPVWAIGTGKVATPAQAQEVHAFIRKEIASAFGQDIAEGLRIQYGGSVKADNIAELMRQPDIDGALVGGASLVADGFAQIVKNAAVAAVH